MAGGRPSLYSDELAARICERISAGSSLRAVCRAKDMPAASSVFLWLGAHKSFSEQYARACVERSEYWAEEIVDIADKTSEDVQRSKLRVDTRKWLMSKLVPKKYGDKVTQEHTGAVSVSIAGDDKSLL